MGLISLRNKSAQKMAQGRREIVRNVAVNAVKKVRDVRRARAGRPDIRQVAYPHAAGICFLPSFPVCGIL